VVSTTLNQVRAWNREKRSYKAVVHSAVDDDIDQQNGEAIVVHSLFPHGAMNVVTRDALNSGPSDPLPFRPLDGFETPWLDHEYIRQWSS
jgi:hypothetical protein